MTTVHARRVAADHVAFCADIAGTASFDAYAGSLVGTPVWQFWRD